MNHVDTEAVTADLQPLLVELIDLNLTGKQAHWNVTGPQFLPIHGQLDELVNDVRTWSDDVAERIMAVGGSADGRSVTVAESSPIDAFPSGPVPSDKVVALVVERLDQIIAATRPRIDRLGATDVVSQDLVISVVAGLEKHRWMFSTQLA
jgi:starvation-inducible DNA-binding protein